MNVQQFRQFLMHPESLDDITASQIAGLIREYPYFQTAHLLLLKNFHNQNDIKFANQLKYSAAFIGDRKILYNLLYNFHSAHHIKEETGLFRDIESDSGPDENKFPFDSVTKSGNLTENTEILSVIPQKRPDISQKLIDKIQKPDIKAENLSVEQTDTDFRAKFSDQGSEKIQIPKLTKQNEPGPIKNVGPEISEIHENTDQPDKDFPEGEIHTFSEWLTLISSDGAIIDAGNKSPGIEKSDLAQKSVNLLIDKFLIANPRIERSKKQDETEIDISQSVSLDDDELMTETLAKIYINQKYYHKAISAYQKLSLQFPEKSIYFATQIEKLKDLINKQ
ncbi:MAG: hypothetical protein NTW49_09975 [Bacteroidia bacterium]|nr:hypothetical protein [Bacteroidia bacterium]